MGRQKQPQTLDLDEVRAARQYHARQVQRYDDLLAFALEVDKRSKKTEHVVDKVRTRVTRDATHAEAVLVKRPSSHPSARASRAQRQAAKSGMRPIDLVRRVFVAHSTESLSVDAIIREAGVSLPAIKGRFDNQVSPEGNTRRAIGLVLKRLTLRGEIKQTAAGSYVARKLAAAANNGVNA